MVYFQDPPPRPFKRRVANVPASVPRPLEISLPGLQTVDSNESDRLCHDPLDFPGLDESFPANLVKNEANYRALYTYGDDWKAYNSDYCHNVTNQLDRSFSVTPPNTTPADSPDQSTDTISNVGSYEWGMAQYARAQSIDNTLPVQPAKRRATKVEMPSSQASERKRNREIDNIDADDEDEYAHESVSKRRRRTAASAGYLLYHPKPEKPNRISIPWSFNDTRLSELFGNDWPAGAEPPVKFVSDSTRRSDRRVTERLMREFVADPFTPRQTGWKRFLERRRLHRAWNRYGAFYHIDDEPAEPKWVQMMKLCALRLPDN